MPGKIVTQDEWVVARKSLLLKEKEQTRNADALAAQVRELPMVKVTKDYTFTGPSGKATLADLFEGRKQLIIYHFMFSPEEDAGCSSCSFLIDQVPSELRHLHSCDVTFAMVSLAPIDKIEAFKKRMGWNFPWYSSLGTSFNMDFHVTEDEAVAPVYYNYKNKDELVEAGQLYQLKGEQPGMSVFLKEGKDVLHTYSAYARGLDKLLVTSGLLDLTPLGRQDNTRKGMGFPYHDEYE